MNKLKLFIVLLLLAITNSNAQVVTLDYSSLASSSCDVFENLTTFQNIFHETKRGDIANNSSQGGLELKYVYNGGGTNQKGSEFALSGITFKKDYKYTIKITAKNNGNYSEAAGLKCNFNPIGIDPQCNGVNFVNQPNGTFAINSSDWFKTVNGTAFVEYTFTSDYLITALSGLGIGTFSRFNISSSSNFSQTIFIKKIEIFEIAPPPSFTFSPTSLGLACGDTSSQTFTMTPANIPSGANVTYLWSYSGSWSGTVNSSMSSVTLTPNSVISLPSTVSVTPYIDGVAYSSKSCTVSRSPIASSGSISGNTTVCTTGTYTFSGLLAGQSVNWSLSNATAGTLSPTSGTSTTFTTTAGGATDIIATVTNSCGESYTKSLSLFAGLPQAFSLVRASNEYCDDIKYHYVPYEIPNRNPLITYTYNVTPIPWVKVTQTSQTYNGVTQDVLVFPKTYSGTIDIYVTTTNSCGTTPFFVEEDPISNCSGLGLRLSSTAEQFTVFPNPANDIVTIELKDSEKQFEKDVTISGELFDMSGQSKSKIKISDNKATFSVKGLKKGIYVLKILINDQVESHRIAVE